MNKKTLFLILSIVGVLVFIGYMTESESQEIFGYEVSIWVFRGAWLIITASWIMRYLQLRKAE